MQSETLKDLKNVVGSIKSIEEYNKLSNAGVNKAKDLLLPLPPLDFNINVFEIHNIICKELYTFSGKPSITQNNFGSGFGALPERHKEEYSITQKQIKQLYNTKDVHNYVYACIYEHARLLYCHFFADGNTRTTSLILEHRLAPLAPNKRINLGKTGNNREYKTALKACTKHSTPNMAPLLNHILVKIGAKPIPLTFIPSYFHLQPLYAARDFSPEQKNAELLLPWKDGCINTKKENYKATWLYVFTADTIKDLISPEHTVSKESMQKAQRIMEQYKYKALTIPQTITTVMQVMKYSCNTTPPKYIFNKNKKEIAFKKNINARFVKTLNFIFEAATEYNPTLKSKMNKLNLYSQNADKDIDI